MRNSSPRRLSCLLSGAASLLESARIQPGITLSPRSFWFVIVAVARLGATLGNEVNLRDFESRSALLLGQAKDNNASCSVGPFIRMFDAHFTLGDV